MVNSSTSNFDRRARRALQPLALGLLLVVVIDLACALAFRAHDPFARFSVHPQAQRVFFLGNSMFKTAYDFDTIGTLAGLGYTPPFDAHVGHYTNLWYLYARAGFAKVKPSLVVWGFRPTYATLPAFRKREPCDVDLLRDYWDANYLAKTGSADLSFAERLTITLETHSFLFGERERLRRVLSRMLTTVTGMLFDPGGAVIAPLLDGTASVADLVQRYGSGGTLAFGEQKVVDSGTSFITGARADFGHSLVPDIVDALHRQQLAQLVVIFKPAAYLDAPMPPADRAFVDASLHYLAARGIAVLNLVDEPRITRQHYADGDHYNAAGRELMTALMAEKLRTVLAQGMPGTH